MSADGRTWTFRLRREPALVRRHAADRRAVRRRPGCGEGRGLAGALFRVAARRRGGPRTGFPDRRARTGPAVPYLPAVLALPVAAPQRRATSAQDASVIGNGPYRLLVRRPGEKIELERNPHYHSAGAVAIERVTYLTLDDLNTELNLYRTGELDITSEVPNSQIDWLRKNLSGELHIAPYLSTYAYAVNLRRVQDRDVRAALVTGDRSHADHRQGDGRGRTARLELGATGNPGLCARSSGLGGAGYECAYEAGAGTLECGPQARHGSSAADPLHRRQRQPSPHGDRARRPVAPALGVEVAIVEMEWKAYLVDARAAGRLRPGSLRLVGRLRRPGSVPRALHVGPRAEHRGLFEPSLRRAAVEGAHRRRRRRSVRRLSPGAERLLLAGRRRHSGLPPRFETPGEARHRRRRGQPARSPALPLPAAARAKK